jgi:hypothetical protein
MVWRAPSVNEAATESVNGSIASSKDGLEYAQHHEQADQEDDQDDPSEGFQHAVSSTMAAGSLTR